ncbi:MAG: 2OG-Fe(II) oxygenase [Proteobacteria bacterium]|nr:2OG-Fe(II) oxygenase [Pseudomonadota bacterium]
MAFIDLDAFRAVPLTREPFDHLVVPDVLRSGAAAEIRADFPCLSSPGLYPADKVEGGSAFRQLIREIESPEMRSAYAGKFGVDLEGRPLMVTVRGRCRATDGKIHVDSTAKLLTSLLYFNDSWAGDGGRLRFLRGPGNVDDFIAEVPPTDGTLVAFRRSDRSWHGHRPFEGERRYIMFNYMTGRAIAAWETARHRASAFAKRLLGAA